MHPRSCLSPLGLAYPGRSLQLPTTSSVCPVTFKIQGSWQLQVAEGTVPTAGTRPQRPPPCHPPSPAGANTTWWGIYATQPATTLLQLPDCGFGANLVWAGRFAPGVRAGDCPRSRWAVQPAGPGTQLRPADLFVTQRARRLLRAP